MRHIRFIVPFSLLLAACSPPAPTEPPKPVAPDAKAATTPAPPPVKPVEIGTCGAQDAVPAGQRVANTPRWTTASEVENFGYDVYRGEAEAGPFTKLTTSPILGGGTTDETRKYEFRDDAIDPCKDYWYYVESISTAGAREKFTPVFKAPAKRRAAAPGELAK